MNYKKEVSYYTVGNIATLFFQWLIIMILPKISNFGEAGIFAVAVSVVSIINQIATFTLNQYQVSDRYEHYSENDYVVARLITIGLSFIFIIPISIIFNYDFNQISIIIAYSVYRNLINFSYLQMSSMQIIGRLDYAGKAMIIEGIVSFSCFIGTYSITSNLLLSTLIMAIAGGGIFLYVMENGYKTMTGKHIQCKIKEVQRLKTLLITGSALLVSMTCPIIITAMPKLLLESYWGDTIVGYFSTLTAPTIVIPTIASSIFAPFIIVFSDICKKNDMRLFKMQFTKIIILFLLGGLFCFLISHLLSEPIFRLIYGPQITQYTDYFDLLVIGISLYSIGTCGITVLITKNQSRYAGIGSFIAMITSIAIFLAIIPDGGLEGASWGLLIAYGLFALILTLFAYVLPVRLHYEDK